MKKIFLIAFIATIAAFNFTGCEKENLKPKSRSISELAPELQELYNQMPVRDYGNITVIDGNILCFESQEHYEHVARQLMEDCRTWDNMFVEAYSHLSPEELSDFEEQIEYSEFVPLQMFEEHYGVSGQMLFDEQQVIEQEWLYNEMKGDDPTDDIFILESDQAMFNTSHEICVDDTIYQFREDAIIIVPVSKLELWKLNRNVSTEEIVGLFIVKKTTGNDNIANMPAHHNFTCKDKKNQLGSNDFSAIGVDGKSVWKVVGNRGLLWSHVVSYKLVNYAKKRNTNKYKRIRQHCSMIAHVKFTTEEYEQFYQTFQYGEVEDGSMDDELPDNKFCQTFSGKIQYQYPNMNCLSHDYLYGCANDGSVLIRIDEDQQTFQSQELPIQWE